MNDRSRHAQEIEALARLASGITHDINNALGAVLTYAHFLSADLDPADPRSRDVEEIRRAGERGASLVRQLRSAFDVGCAPVTASEAGTALEPGQSLTAHTAKRARLEAPTCEGTNIPDSTNIPNGTERDKKSSFEEVNRKYQELEAENRRMRESNRFRSEFLERMSDELQTPLTAVIGLADLMHKGKAGPVADLHREYLGDILTSSRHLLALINDVLEMANIDSGLR